MVLVNLVVTPFARPVADQPHLTIKVQRPGEGSYGASVSKTKVNLENNGELSEGPAYPHVPPFLAFKKVQKRKVFYEKPQPSPQYFPTPLPSKVLPAVKKIAKKVES